MKEIVVENLDDIVGFGQNGPAAIAYRGMADADHDLLSRVARLGLLAKPEQDTLDLFRLRGHDATPSHLPPSELAWMSLGQHHGLATRLMDWSQSILVAAYFAVEEPALTRPSTPPSVDAAIYALVAPYAFAAFHRLPKDVLNNPRGWGKDYELESTASSLRATKAKVARSSIALLFIPPVVSARISVQSSLFLLSRDPLLPVNDYPKEEITRLRIPAACRRAVFRSLLLCGIHRQALFPDLDGIASHANTLAVEQI